jgi:hypothetical protein
MRAHIRRFQSNAGEKIMTMKYILAVALVAPFLATSGMAQDAPRLDQHVYQGGPKSNIPHATRQVTGVDEAFAMVPKASTSHRYSGGPQTVVPHSMNSSAGLR